MAAFPQRARYNLCPANEEGMQHRRNQRFQRDSIMSGKGIKDQQLPHCPGFMPGNNCSRISLVLPSSENVGTWRSDFMTFFLELWRCQSACIWPFVDEHGIVVHLLGGCFVGCWSSCQTARWRIHRAGVGAGVCIPNLLYFSYYACDKGWGSAKSPISDALNSVFSH